MHLKSLMRGIGFIKNPSFKLSIIALSFVALGIYLNAGESLNVKAQRISFPGITHVNFNRSMKDLNLEKIALLPESKLVQNLNELQIKPTSALFMDKKNNLMFIIGEKSGDKQLVFAVIKNNQVTQLQKINDITDKNIVLQYGRINLNAQTATAATTEAADAL